MDSQPPVATRTEEASQADLLPSERIAGSLLPKVLTTFDMVAIFICIVLFISNSALMTGAGPAAYVYWLLGFVTFLVPGAIVTGQLGRMFPGEGSLYLWTHKALGDFAGFFAGFCAWFPGVLGLVATADGALTLLQQLNGAWLSQPWQEGCVIILIIALSATLALARLRLTQRLVNLVCLAYGGAILLIGIGGLLALLHHQVAPIDYALHNWLPTPATFTFYGTVVLALLGVEVPLNLGVEIKESRAVTHYLLWGSLVIMLAYLVGTFGVMIAVPLSDQSSPAAVAEAVRLGFGGTLGQFLGLLVTLIFVGFFVLTTAVFNYSFARLLFVSGLDRHLPSALSRLNANRVPSVAVLVQSVLASLVAALIFLVAPVTLHLLRPADLTTIVYDVLQAALTVIWCVSMVFLFCDVVLIRRKYREHFARQQLAPGWVFHLCLVLGVLASSAGVLVIFTNPWVNLLSRRQWDLALLALLLVAALAALLTYSRGYRRRQAKAGKGEVA
jgi:amino acid transporter